MIIDEERGEVEDTVNFRVENDRYVFKFVNDYIRKWRDEDIFVFWIKKLVKI